MQQKANIYFYCKILDNCELFLQSAFLSRVGRRSQIGKPQTIPHFMKNPDISNFVSALLFGAVVLNAPLAGAADPVILHVNVAAVPRGDGTENRPFPLIEEAVAAARQHKQSPVIVRIAPGHYVMRNGLLLGPGDNRQADAPVRYEALDPANVRVSSGILIPLEKMQPVSDDAVLQRLPESSRRFVRELSLDDLDLQATRFPDRFRGLDLLEVFWDGERLPISRWPEAGKFSTMERVTDNGLGQEGGTFVYRGEVPQRWVGVLEDGVWLRGFWRVPWVIEAVRVGSIDPEKRTITHAVPIPNGIGSKYHRAPNNGPGPGSGQETWEAINLIEEIDTPGEWAVRFSTRKLYIYPPGDSGELLITDLREPVVALAGVSNTSLIGWTVDSGLGDGILVSGGENVLIAGCKVSNVSRNGIVLNGGLDHTILSCDTTNTGYSGISFLGGDRRTLSPSGHRILNNLVSRAGLYFPAAGIVGGDRPQAEAVGNRVAHNRIHDCANSGIVYGGNENLFEYNEIYRVGLGSSDLGCFYTNSGWTSRGNVIRNNFVHHSMNANAFYVDDGDAGDLFHGNVAYRTQSGGFIGGGHDQTFRHNIIVSNTRAMHVDARGIARGYTVDDTRLRADLESVPFLESPWSEKYPSLVGILESQPEYPSGILIEENLFVDNEEPLRKANSDRELQGLVFTDNFVSDDMDMFVDVEALDFTLKENAPVFAAIPGFPQVPMAKIGIYSDQYRPVVPPRDMELLRTGNTAGGGFDSLVDVEATNRKAE
jgi:hypothetical protein